MTTRVLVVDDALYMRTMIPPERVQIGLDATVPPSQFSLITEMGQHAFVELLRQPHPTNAFGVLLRTAGVLVGSATARGFSAPGVGRQLRNQCQSFAGLSSRTVRGGFR